MRRAGNHSDLDLSMTLRRHAVDLEPQMVFTQLPGHRWPLSRSNAIFLRTRGVGARFSLLRRALRAFTAWRPLHKVWSHRNSHRSGFQRHLTSVRSAFRRNPRRASRDAGNRRGRFTPESPAKEASGFRRSSFSSERRTSRRGVMLGTIRKKVVEDRTPAPHRSPSSVRISSSRRSGFGPGTRPHGTSPLAVPDHSRDRRWRRRTPRRLPALPESR